MVIRPFHRWFVVALAFSSCSGAAFIGTGTGRKEKKAGKAESAAEPVVVTGTYLTCVQMVPSQGGGAWIEKTSEIGCDAFSAQKVRLDSAFHGDLGAILTIKGAVVEEKQVDLSQNPHVKFEVKNKDLEFAQFGVKGSNAPDRPLSADSPIIICGDQGNGCYDNNIALSAGRAKLATYKNELGETAFIEYVNADPDCADKACFKIWVWKKYNLFLPASGLGHLSGSSRNWQKKTGFLGFANARSAVFWSDEVSR